jgi:putative oxidoreductase
MTRSNDIGKFVLRVSLGILVLLHGIAKARDGGAAIDNIWQMLSSHGVPGVVAYLVFVGEILAPVLLITGIYTRTGAWILVVNRLVAFWLAQSSHLREFSKNGGWAPELTAMYLFAAISVAFLGAGRISLGGGNERYN